MKYKYGRRVFWCKGYPITINTDGTVSPSEEPGANFDINREVLAPYRVG